jgi:hypothetical protein
MDVVRLREKSITCGHVERPGDRATAADKKPGLSLCL